MGDQGEVIQACTEALGKALGERGVDRIEWRIAGGNLQLDLLPRETFPFQLRVVPGGKDANCFIEGDLAGIFYMTPDSTVELDKPVVKEIRAIGGIILEHMDAVTLESVRSYVSDDWDRLTRVDQAALVKAGHLPAAVITIPDTPDELERLAAELPAVLPAGDELNARRQEQSPPKGPGETSRHVYIGADQRTVRRLSELDEILYSSADRAAKAAAITEVTLLFGVPKCCAGTYSDHLANPSGVPGHVAFLRRVEQWSEETRGGELPPIHPRLTNFLAARSHRLSIIDYWPCSPACEESIYRNRRMLNDLYDEVDRNIIEEILGTSYLGWGDGRLLPFRIEEVEGTELRVVDGRRAPWASLALDDYRRSCCPSVPGGGRTADLRRLTRRGRSWRWRDGSRWRRVQGDRTGWLRQRPPLAALFGDS